MHPILLRVVRRPLVLLALAAAAAAQDRNVLLILLDDVGVDRVACYGLAPDPPATPTLDGLAAEGVRFENVWAQPYCGPSRAALLTGRFGFRTGLGQNVEHGLGKKGLALEEWTLPEVVRAGSEGRVRSAACGKWHLASFDQGDDHPRAQGFERARLTQGNLGGFESFTKLVDGQRVEVERYATSDTVDDALALAAGFGDEPWLLYVALHAAHVPFHAPPAHLRRRELEGEPEDDAPAHHKAAVEAADAELGRLLAGLPPAVRARTTVIVMGDNGTPRPAVEAPFLPEHAKGTLYEGSLRVPLIVQGAGVAARGARCTALLASVDVFATAAELLGVEARAVVPPDVRLDGTSFAALLADPAASGAREVAFAERFAPNHSVEPTRLWRAVRGPRFKLIRNVLKQRDRLYDLEADPHEEHELLGAGQLSDAARAAHAQLSAALTAIVGS